MNVKQLVLGVMVTTTVLSSCVNETKDTNDTMDTSQYSSLLPDRESYMATIDNKAVSLFIIKNQNGLEVAITNYGGRIVGLVVPDKDGKPTDVVIGMDSAKGYAEATEPYLGALIGRVGNRLANGKFTLDDVEYSVFTNNGPNALHGGKKGFQDVVWDAEQTNDSTLVLNYLSADGEEGFPGNLNVKVTYSVTDDQGLKIDYEATTDKRTPVNLTSHAFFNLNGEGSGTINNHVLQIDADEYTPVDTTLIPLGDNESVEGTPFDFRKPTEIGERLDQKNAQLSNGDGYDHNFVLNNNDFGLAAKVVGDKSGIVMEVYTSEPGLQFYGGNFMAGKNALKSGGTDEYRTAFCLETQHFPDSPNQPNFPSITLEPGDVYKTSTVYRFSN